MRIVPNRFALLLLALFAPAATAQGLPGAPSSRDGAAEKTPVTTRLISMYTEAIPGQELYLGIDFSIAPGWHIYWKNAGESGAPIDFSVKAPEGVEVGDAMWPAPRRFIAPGDILDYVYKDGVTIIVPVRIPADAEAGAMLEFEADVSWLQCNDDVCVPGSGRAVVSVPVSSSTKPQLAPDFSRFTAAALRTPTATLDKAKGDAKWEGDDLVISVPSATKLVFFPGPDDGVFAEKMIENGEAEGAEIRIPYRFNPNAQQNVTGVLEIVRQGAPSWCVNVDVARPE